MTKFIILFTIVLFSVFSLFAVDIITDEEIMINDFRIILFKQYNGFYIKGYKGEVSIFKRKLLLEPDYLNDKVVFKTAKFIDIDQISVKYSYKNRDYYNVFTLTHNEGQDKIIDIIKNGLYSIIDVKDSTNPYDEELFDPKKEIIYDNFKIKIVNEKNDFYCYTYFKNKLKFKLKLYLISQLKKTEIQAEDAEFIGVRKFLKDVDGRYFELIIKIKSNSDYQNAYIKMSSDGKLLDFLTKEIQE